MMLYTQFLIRKCKWFYCLLCVLLYNFTCYFRKNHVRVCQSFLSTKSMSLHDNIFLISILLIIFPYTSFLLAIRSLKLGVVPGATALHGSRPLAYTIRNTVVEGSNFSWSDKRSRQGRDSSILTRSCLAPLNGDTGAPGYVILGHFISADGWLVFV